MLSVAFDTAICEVAVPAVLVTVPLLTKLCVPLWLMPKSPANSSTPALSIVAVTPPIWMSAPVSFNRPVPVVASM